MSAPRRLADLVVELGLGSEDAVEAALAESRERGRRLPIVLAARGVVDEERLAKAVASRLGLDVASLDPVRVHPRVLGRVPPDVAKRHGVLPFAVKRSDDAEILYLVMSDPLDTAALTEVQRGTGCRVKVLMAPASLLEAAIADCYAPLRAGRPASPAIIPGRPPPSLSSDEEMGVGDVTVVDHPRELLSMTEATVPGTPVLPPFLSSEPEPFDLSKRLPTVLGTPIEEDELNDEVTVAEVITRPPSPVPVEPLPAPSRSAPPPSSSSNNHVARSPAEIPTEVPASNHRAARALLLPLEVPVAVVETSHPFQGPSPSEVPVGLGETAVIPHLDRSHDRFEPPPPPDIEPSPRPRLVVGAGDIPFSPADVAARAAEGVTEDVSEIAEIEEVHLEPLEEATAEIAEIDIDDEMLVEAERDVRAALSEVAAAREPTPTPIPTPLAEETAVFRLEVDPEAERLVAALESGASLNAPDRARLILALGRCLLERGVLPREALLRALSEP